jgi:hypothetical protein
MPSFNQDSFGEVIRVNFNEDISTGTAFKMILEPEHGDLVEVTATLGTGTPYEDDVQLAANQYIEYTIQEGDFSDYAGRWRKKGIATLPAGDVSTDFRFFEVMP